MLNPFIRLAHQSSSETAWADPRDVVSPDGSVDDHDRIAFYRDYPAEETHTHWIQFEPGKSSAVISGNVTGRDAVLYKLNSKDKQFIKLSLKPDNESAEYNLYIPGRGPGDEALHISATAGRRPKHPRSRKDPRRRRRHRKGRQEGRRRHRRGPEGSR